jgi:hypothetical protein
MNPTGPSSPRSIGAFAFADDLMKLILHGASPAGYASRYAACAKEVIYDFPEIPGFTAKE